MALAFVAGSRNFDDASGTSLASYTVPGGDALSLNVQINDLLVAWFKHEGGPTTISTFVDTAGNTWNPGSWRNHANGDLSGIFYWTQATAANAADIVTVTTVDATVYRRIVVLQFRPDAGETINQAGEITNEGTSGAPNTGNITWSTTDGVAVAAYGEYSTTNITTPTINGQASTFFPNNGANPYTKTWYNIVTAGFTGGCSTATYNDAWICNLIAFDSAVASAKSIAVPPRRIWRGYR